MFSPHARWIWLPAVPEVVNHFVEFRRSFTLPAPPASAELLLTVDSDYQLFVNGTEVWGRQFSDYPERRSVNRHEVAPLLRPGANVLAVRCYHRGESSSDHRTGRPGLLAQLTAGAVTLWTDAAWRCRLSPVYRSGPLPRVSGQMSFTSEYDARGEDGWTAPAYADGAWTAAAELAGPTDGFWRELRPRPLPQLVCQPFLPGVLVGSGTLADIPADQSPAMTVAGSRKVPGPVAPGQPFYQVVDLGHEEVGLLHLEVEAPAGTRLDIAHGEHLVAGGVCAVIHNRQFADRVWCRAGRTVYTLFHRRLGCRYLELHCAAPAGPVVVHCLGVIPVSYPLTLRGRFAAPDPLLERLDQVGRRTLDLCLHEHYEDCPWREQSLYAFDSRNQALYGYYAFGEYDAPEESFRLLGWGQGDDGLLELCAPAKVRITIPSFSHVWIAEVRDHVLFSGRPALWREFRPTIERVLATNLARRDAATGLCALFEGERYWTFYEWAPGLDNRRRNDAGELEPRLDAPHNLFLLEALRAAAELCAWAGEPDPGWQRAAAELAAAIHRVFWLPGERRYATFAHGDRRWHTCELVQALAAYHGLPGARDLAPLPADAVPMTLSTLPYAAWIALEADEAGQTAILQRGRATYGAMLAQGATSLWETSQGAADFGGAGSLCHGWSALPVWLSRAYVLGVFPTAPGFAQVRLAPHVADLPWAEGVVPTPHGPLYVRWERQGEEVIVRWTAPAACTVTLQPPAHSRLHYRRG
jgi:hypothetical protein